MRGGLSQESFFSKVFGNRIIGERVRGKENLRKILFFFFLYFREKIKMEQGFLKRRIESEREFFSKVFENRIIGEGEREGKFKKNSFFFFFILEEK